MLKILKNNIMYTSDPIKGLNHITDEQLVCQIKEALDNNWNINTKYGNDSNFYNMLHAVCMNGKIFYNSTQLLLEKGIEKNIQSGNDNTAFTFFVSSITNDMSNEDVIEYAELLKKYNVDLKARGYDSETPLELYERYCYNKDLKQPIVDYLIKNSDFENGFLLRDIFTHNKLFTIQNLKTILSHHKIDLKKVIVDENDNEETYVDGIARGLIGKYWKPNYEKINWLHDKLGFDLDSYHTYKDFNGKDDNEFRINLLGMAIQHENSNMFEWVMKRRPEQVYDNFYINDKPYSFLEFCLLCDFRKGAKMALRSMKSEDLIGLNMPYLRKLCESNTIPRTLETLEKTYTHLIYKHMKNKYENNSQLTHKDKKLKI